MAAFTPPPEGGREGGREGKREGGRGERTSSPPGGHAHREKPERDVEVERREGTDRRESDIQGGREEGREGGREGGLHW